MSELRTKPTFELAHTAMSEAEALRRLGRNDEAAKIEQRIKTIQATAMNQN